MFSSVLVLRVSRCIVMKQALWVCMDIVDLALNMFDHKNTKIVSPIFQFYNALR